MAKKKPPIDRRKLKRALSRMQTLFGRAEGIYHDDRNPNRADLLLPVLREGFELAVKTIGELKL